MSAAWFRELALVHRTSSRLRFRYTCWPETPSDAKSIARAVETLPGIASVRVNPAARSLVLHLQETEADADPTAWLSALQTLQPLRMSKQRKQALAAAEAPAPLAVGLASLLASSYLPAPLRLPVTFAAALPLLQHAVQDLLENGVTSHVLEALAVSISMARKDYLAANTTTFMLALGGYLENSIARRSDELLKHLLRPVSDEVWVERHGEEVLIPSTEVSVGDIVIVGAGNVIAIDGTVVRGSASVNEAAMTGESVSVVKQRGDTVLSGTLVEDGRIAIYAEQVGHHTAVARIADYVEQSLVTKSVAQLNASRLADRLVPTVFGLAGLSYLVSGDWRRAASVLQADYSCALKLATPVAFKSAMFGAGHSGILVKGASALERLAEADTFIFDKTGTLTTGILTVTDSIALDDDFSPEELIWLAASVEEHYFHPLALAVVAAARESHGKHFEHAEVQFIVAHGVASEIKGKRIVVGSRHFVEEDEGIDTAPHRPRLNPLYLEGKTLLYIGFGGKLIGAIALKDEVRAASAATVTRLRELGAKRVLLLTGDHELRAKEMCVELKLDGYHAQLLPEEKAQIIERLSNEGARIAFIGDGINDAPALAGAHVGIAMQKGADIARLTADIALLEDSIERVADAKAIANSTMELIGENFKLTLGLNTAILSAAAFGLLNPIATALLHNGTTIAILVNALRRKRV